MIIKPTIHLNGTSAKSLQEEHLDAYHAIQAAIDALPHPNGRDYYPQGPEVVYAAIEQRNAWSKQLTTIAGELMEIIEHIDGLIS